jgi:hypothetical protein
VGVADQAGAGDRLDLAPRGLVEGVAGAGWSLIGVPAIIRISVASTARIACR